MIFVDNEKELRELIISTPSLIELFNCKKLLIHISFQNIKHYYTKREKLNADEREFCDLIINHARLSASNGNVTIASRIDEVLLAIQKMC